MVEPKLALDLASSQKLGIGFRSQKQTCRASVNQACRLIKLDHVPQQRILGRSRNNYHYNDFIFLIRPRYHIAQHDVGNLGPHIRARASVVSCFK